MIAATKLHWHSLSMDSVLLGSISFASEFKALTDKCARFENFPPGQYYQGGTGKFHRWYTPKWVNRELIPSGTLDLTELREQFEAAVVRRLMSDVPWGVLLSGGLDSSLVASICARHAAARIETGGSEQAWFPRLHSFSIGLEGSPDLAAAQKVADYLGTVHHPFVFTVQEGLDALEDVIYHLETYDVTTIRASTPMFLMSRKIKAMGIKMVLSGEGADEVFGMSKDLLCAHTPPQYGLILHGSMLGVSLSRVACSMLWG
eukprot:m.523121 g.523121  ORF g.523121 m.523121 type:complete len:260 (+) comp21973_c0_seq20:826-1605(+)